jgi:hypothetical protein
MTFVECREHAHPDETFEIINYEFLMQPIDFVIFGAETVNCVKGQCRQLPIPSLEN